MEIDYETGERCNKIMDNEKVSNLTNKELVTFYAWCNEMNGFQMLIDFDKMEEAEKEIFRRLNEND